jgi:hypothetical protein
MNNRYFSLEEAQEWLGKLNINSGGLPNHLQLFNTDTARKYTNYKLVFSISKNNIQRFENLLDRFLKDGFKVQISEGLRQYYEIFDDKTLSDLNKIQNREEHRYYNTDFVRFTYEFKNISVLPLVCYCQIIFDIINIIGKYWEFDSNGKEICNIKYQLGSIVSLKNDKSDFLIESIEFLRKNSERYDSLVRNKNIKFDDDEFILYKLLKIENSNSQVLKFVDREYIVTSSDIVPNRNSRIDEILG